MKYSIILLMALLGLSVLAQREHTAEPGGLLTSEFDNEYGTSFVASEPETEAGFALSFCGDGIYSPGELCFGAPSQVAPSGTPFDFYDIAVGYMNLGNNLDFVTTRRSNNFMFARLGSGDGTFWGYYSYPMGTDLGDVAMGDFNGDGRTDVICTDLNQDLVFIRWGYSNYSTYAYYSVGNGPGEVVVGDLNNDGLDDFVTANEYSTSFTVGLRSGSTFVRSTVHNNGVIKEIGLADLNNDGYDDLVFSEGTEAGCRLNRGNGTFGSRRSINLGTHDYGLQDFTLGDFNNDGDVDMIAVYYYNASLVRVLGNGNGTFTSPVSASSYAYSHMIESYDINLDGNLDLIQGGAGSVQVFLGNGNGSLAYPKSWSASQVNDVKVGDFNKDGDPDLVYITNITGGKNTVMLRLANP